MFQKYFEISLIFFVENANESIKFLRKMDEIGELKKEVVLHISHKKTKKIGLIASHLFDKKISEIKILMKRRRLPLQIVGEVSDDKKINNFLLSFGLLKKLGISASETTSHYDLDHNEKSLRFARENSKIKPLEKQKAAVDLANYFNSCLNHQGYSLKEKYRAEFINSIGELIDNAEQHGGSYWAVLGYYDKDNEVCKFAIFSEGKTIYQTLAGEHSTQREAVLKMIPKQLSFSMTRNSPEAECIWNVASLQEGISCMRTKKGEDSSRGQGLMEVVAFIKSIDQKALLSLVSGKSSIKINHKYDVSETVIDGQVVRRIFFNKEQSFNKPMDKDNVFLNKENFQGTAASGNFKLSELNSNRTKGL